MKRLLRILRTLFGARSESSTEGDDAETTTLHGSEEERPGTETDELPSASDSVDEADVTDTIPEAQTRQSETTADESDENVADGNEPAAEQQASEQSRGTEEEILPGHRVYWATDPGIERDTNEDSVLCTGFEDLGYVLIAVADGMGGHEAGDVASQTALEALEESIAADTRDGITDRETLLKNGYEQAQTAVTELREDEHPREPGTTLVGGLINDENAVIANVGDSRAYAITESIEQITTDQTQVQELVEAGELDEEAAEDHPFGNMLSQAIGTADDLDVDFFRFSSETGCLLLCSDGLTDPVSDETIERTIMESSTLTAAGTSLIDQTLDAGAPDNVTVALYEQV